MKPPFTISKYKPQTAKALSWQEIEQKYADLTGIHPEFNPMLLLVKHIASTTLSTRLFAYTSMHKLIISIYNPIEWNREALHVEFDTLVKKWYFWYYSKPKEPIEFERTYSSEKGIEKFDAFIRQINW